MKNTKEFSKNPYSARIRLKPEKLILIKQDFRKLGYVSAANYLDAIVEEHYKPNLFKKKK